MKFKNYILEEVFDVAKYISEQQKYLVNGSAKGSGVVTLYVKGSGTNIKQIDVIWMEVDGKPITDKEQEEMYNNKDYSYKREQIQIKKMKNNWKTTKETNSKLIEPNQKLSDDDVIAVLKQVPFKN